MRTAHLKGTVHPLEAKCNLPEPLSFDWVWQERNATLKFIVAIRDGHIDVECTVPPKYRDADMVELHRRAFDLCRAVVNLDAFRQGIGLTVILDKFVSPLGVETVLLPHDGALEHLCTLSISDLPRILEIVIAEISLIRHISDLIAAITIPHEAIVNCARAVEGIKALISPDEQDDRKAWQGMREALNIEKDYLTLITEVSKKPRHGRHERIGGMLVSEITRRSWSVMNRYLEYRMRGGTRLPFAEFPPLQNPSPTVS